jgi:serine/threonine-protein kinase
MSIDKRLMLGIIRRLTHSWNDIGRPDSVKGERLLEAGNYAEAEKCLTLAVKHAPREPVDTRIELQLQLAEAQRKQGKLAEAEASMRAALEEAGRGADHSIRVLCLRALGELLLERAEFAGAEETFREMVNLESARRRPDPVLVAGGVRQLGIALHRDGRREQAAAELEKALKLYGTVYGQEHAETAHVMSDLAAAYRAQQKHPEAQRNLISALALHEKWCGSHSEEALHDLRELAESLAESGDIDGAASRFERALTITEQAVGGDRDQLAEMQFNLAASYAGWGKYTRARELLIQAIGAFKRSGGPRLAIALEALANVHECSGNLDAAMIELERAAKVWESCGSERSRELEVNTQYRNELMAGRRR